MKAVLTHPAVRNLIRSSKEEKSVSFSSKSTLLDTLKVLLCEAVATNRKVVITSDHTKDLKELFDYIRSQYLFAMYIDSEFVSTDCINQWRLALKRKSNVQNRLMWNGLSSNIKRIESEIVLYFQQTYQKNLSNLSLNEQQNEFELYMPLLEYAIPPQLFNGTDIEFQDLTKMIDKFSLTFNSEYKLLTQIDNFDDYMKSIIDSEVIPLDKLALRANELIILYLNNINSYKAKWQEQLKSQEKMAVFQLRSLNLINEKLKALNLELNKSSSLIERFTSNFQLKTQQDNFKYSIELEFDEWLNTFSTEMPRLYAEYALSEESTIEPNVLILKQLLQTHIIGVKKQRQIQGQQQFNQLNAQNSPQIFKDILDELKHFYTDLSEYKLLDSIGKDKSFNLYSSYQYLVRVKSMLDSIRLMNEIYPAYVQWKKDLNGLNKLEKLIVNTFAEQITGHQNWTAIFKEYYSKILRSIAIPDIDINELIATYISLRHKEESIEKESLNNILKFDLRKNIEALKNSNPKLFKDLFQKKYRENSLSIYPLFEQDNTLLPLCFARKEILGQTSHAKWDLHIHIDFFGEDERINDLPIRGKEIIYLQHNGDSSAIDFDSKTYLKHPKIQTDENQLNFCRTLSKKLSIYLDRAQIFNSGEMFIISFLDKVLNVKMLEINDHLTFKEFIIDNDLNYSLEDILFNKAAKIIILTQDGVLNPYDALSLDWQLHLIRLMKEAGMNIQTVELAELKDGNSSSLLLKKSEERITVVDQTIKLQHNTQVVE